jgi:hypothetical protein
VTTTHLPRRAVVGAVLAASLIGVGLTVASAADPAPCTTFTDPKGDSAPVDAPMVPAAEDDLDITGVAFDAADTSLVASVYVAALDVAPQYALGDEFKVSFKHGGKLVELYSYRYNPSDVGDAASALYDQSGMDVDGKAATTTMKVTYDQKASRVVFTLPLPELEKATSTPTTGAALSALAAESSGDQVAIGEPWDEAAAPKDLTYAIGSTCGGVAVTPVAVPVPSATPAAAPVTLYDPAADPSKLPRKECFLAKDPKGDGTIDGVAPNDPDLDLTNVTLGADAKNLYAYLRVDKLAAGPAIHDGHRFYVNFTFNKHTFTAAGSAYKNAQSGDLKDGLAQTGQVAHVTQLAVDGVSSATDPERVTGNGPGFVESGLKFVFDTKTSVVTAILPVADVEKYGKAPLSGATLTGVYFGSYGDSYAVATGADQLPDGATAPADSKITYVVGDNHCFAPPPPPLTSIGVSKAQYGDVAAVAAKLVDANGVPVGDTDVTFSLGLSKVVATTGDDGIAKAALLVKDKAGKRTLSIVADDVKTSLPFTVLVEKTALKAIGGSGNVTAVLTDDDKHPVKGQAITFVSGAKKVTVKTSAQGIAKAGGFPAGSAVKVVYAGAAGMYSVASASAKA